MSHHLGVSSGNPAVRMFRPRPICCTGPDASESASESGTQTEVMNTGKRFFANKWRANDWNWGSTLPNRCPVLDWAQAVCLIVARSRAARL